MSEINRFLARVNTLSFALFLLISISSPLLSVAQPKRRGWKASNIVNQLDTWNSQNVPSKGQAKPDGAPTISANQLGAPDKARKALQKAREAWQMDKLADAEMYVTRALAAYPHYAMALVLRGMITMERDPQQACEDLQKAIEYDPNYGPAYAALGSAYNRLGRFDDAALTLDHALAIAPTLWQGYYERSVTSLGKAEFGVALRLIQKASSLAQMEYPPVHMVKAFAFIGLQNKPAAITELTTFLLEAPNDPLAPKAKQKLESLAASSDGQ